MGFNKVEIESICIRQASGIVHKGGRRHSEHYLQLHIDSRFDYPYLHSIVVKLREREGRRVDLGRSLKSHL